MWFVTLKLITLVAILLPMAHQAGMAARDVQGITASPAAKPNIIWHRESGQVECRFTKRIREGNTWLEDAAEVGFCPVPYRRETNGKTQEFPLREVAEHGSSSSAWMEPVYPRPPWGAEGWVWTRANSAFLLAKYNHAGMEWSLMEPLKRGTETIVRFGGAGQWKHGHPEGWARLDPGTSYQFGETRLQAADGDYVKEKLLSLLPEQ